MATYYFPRQDALTTGNRDWRNNVLWISIEPRKIREVEIVKTNLVFTESVGDKLIFLAPNELQENIRHTWEPLENIAAGFAKAISSMANKMEQGTETSKVDTPMMYKDSDRREMLFLFTLAYTGKDTVYNEVVKPAKDLSKWSCVDISETIFTGEGVRKLGPPYVFRIRTLYGNNPVNLINIRNAALTSIQPTFSGPYKDGYPMRCELTLQFQDIEPLDKDRSFEQEVEFTTS